MYDNVLQTITNTPLVRINHLNPNQNVMVYAKLEKDEEGFLMAKRLCLEEGIFVGMSSGAAMHAAVEQAKKMEEGMIVVLLPDGGEKYLSTVLFD